MRMILKLLIVCVLCLLTVGILYFVGLLIYSSITEFNPDKIETLKPDEKGIDQIPANTEISLLTWNIGYAGLGAEMDFFYEGGKMVRPSESLNLKYFKGITDFISSNDTLDFILLQEVDFDSKRSYNANQSDALLHTLPDHNKILTFNYKSKYIPVPFSNPMGKVNSGLVTFSKYSAHEAKRFATPGNYSWRKRMFMLKRCFLLTRYLIDNDKEVVLLNIHNSAFEDATELREVELEFLKEFVIEEYEIGNYVIVGGDWNQNPPGSNLNKIKDYVSSEIWPIDENYLPDDWRWVYDPEIPTNRDVTEPFDKSTTTTTILDYFLVSPNIEILECKTVDMGFEFSDHQPVITKLELK